MQQPNALKAPSHPQPNSIFETASRPQKPPIEDSENDANDHSGKQTLLEVVDAADGTANASCVKEHIVKSIPDASQSSQAATPRDIEDFGRSLKPNTFLRHNFSTLNQIQSRKNMEFNPIDQDVNKFKVSDDVGERQFDSNHGQWSYGYNYAVEDVLGNNSAVPGDGREANASSEEVVEYGQKNAANSNKFEISYECLAALKDDLEWKLIYVGSAEDETYDQLLESVLVVLTEFQQPKHTTKILTHGCYEPKPSDNEKNLTAISSYSKEKRVTCDEGNLARKF
ncbi:hypothetical protein RYX36_011269 [Vicia faba]